MVTNQLILGQLLTYIFNCDNMSSIVKSKLNKYNVLLGEKQTLVKCFCALCQTKSNLLPINGLSCDEINYLIVSSQLVSV